MALRYYLKTSLMEDNTPIEEQIEILANFIQEEFPDEIKGGGAIETAIEIMKKYKRYIT